MNYAPLLAYALLVPAIMAARHFYLLHRADQAEIKRLSSQTIDLVTASRMGPDQIEDNLALRKIARERGFQLHKRRGA